MRARAATDGSASALRPRTALLCGHGVAATAGTATQMAARVRPRATRAPLEAVLDVLSVELCSFLPAAAVFTLPCVNRAREADHPRLVFALARRRGAFRASRLARAAFKTLQEDDGVETFHKSWDNGMAPLPHRPHLAKSFWSNRLHSPFNLHSPINQPPVQLGAAFPSAIIRRDNTSVLQVLPDKRGWDLRSLLVDKEPLTFCVQRVRVMLGTDAGGMASGCATIILSHRVDESATIVKKERRIASIGFIRDPVAMEGSPQLTWWSDAGGGEIETYLGSYEVSKLHEVTADFDWSDGRALVRVNGGAAHSCRFGRYPLNHISLQTLNNLNMNALFGPFSVSVTSDKSRSLFEEESSDDDDDESIESDQ